MGVFQKYVKVFNRAPEPRPVMFDGQRAWIAIGHDELPEQTVRYAQNQNPIMGTGNPNDPGMSGTRYLIVREGQEGYGEPLTKEEWEAHLGRPCRIDEEAAFAEKYGDDPKARLVTIGSKKKKLSKFEVGGNPGGLADYTTKE